LVGALLLVFGFMVFTAGPHITHENLSYINFDGIYWIFPVAILCFAYTTIVPSLHAHCGTDKKLILRVLFVGGFISLLMYLIWQYAVLGTLPLEGSHGIHALHAQNVSSLTTALLDVTQSHSLPRGLSAFAFIAVATSFMSVAKIVFDFFNDGLCQSKVKHHRRLAQFLTLVPPVIVALYIPGLFVYAITFSGAIMGILLVFLPAFLVWRGRYVKHLSTEYTCWGGKPLLIIIMILGIVIAFIEVIHKLF
jgi:tyrosine-specific transport protein